MESAFEQMGGTYTLQGDYYLPDLKLPAEADRPIGVWGQRSLRFLKQHHRVLYYNLLTSGKLHAHLADTEERAQAMFLRLVTQYSQREAVTEHLKADDPMVWIRRMNNIQARVQEIVYSEVIFA